MIILYLKRYEQMFQPIARPAESCNGRVVVVAAGVHSFKTQWEIFGAPQKAKIFTL